MWRRRERFIEAFRRERADPRCHIELTWCSLGALLLVAGLAAAGMWGAVTFLPPMELFSERSDYRFMLGACPIFAYPWLHARLRRAAGR